MNSSLDQSFQSIIDYYGGSDVSKSMSYSFMDTGKRLRPRLLIALLEDYGVDIEKGIHAAAALEMVHTYSLIHDDLPAMDNDDIRRFRPTNHIVFGEDIAILGGDGLITAAFETLTQAPLSNSQIVSCIAILAKNSGAHGMILGQELDIKNKINTLDDLISCYELKTGCLFAAAFEMALVISGKESLVHEGEHLGKLLGTAFQFQDDLLEVTKTQEKIGKSTSSDDSRNKHTIVTLCGLEKALKLTDDLFVEIDNVLINLGLSNGSVNSLLQELIQREL